MGGSCPHVTLVITSHQPILCLCNEYDCPRNDGRGSATRSQEANIRIPREAEITEISQISVIQPNAMWRPADADDTQFLRNAIIRNVLFVWNRWQQQMGPGQTCKRGLTMFGMESTILRKPQLWFANYQMQVETTCTNALLSKILNNTEGHSC